MNNQAPSIEAMKDDGLIIEDTPKDVLWRQYVAYCDKYDELNRPPLNWEEFKEAIAKVKSERV